VRRDRRAGAHHRRSARGDADAHRPPARRLEYPSPRAGSFELSKQWFDYDFKEPPAMSRVMAWDPHFGGPHAAHEARDGAGRVLARREGDVAAAVSGVNACTY